MFKSIAIWMVVALVLMTVFNQFNTTRPQQAQQTQLDYSQFLEEVKPPMAGALPAMRRPICGWSQICSRMA